MSAIEVTPQLSFDVPTQQAPVQQEQRGEEPQEVPESHLLAKVIYDGEVCLAGISAVAERGAPMVIYAVKTADRGVIYPSAEKQGILFTTEVAPLDFDTKDLHPHELLGRPEMEKVDELNWVPASYIVGIIRATEIQPEVYKVDYALDYPH